MFTVTPSHVSPGMVLDLTGFAMESAEGGIVYVGAMEIVAVEGAISTFNPSVAFHVAPEDSDRPGVASGRVVVPANFDLPVLA